MSAIQLRRVGGGGGSSSNQLVKEATFEGSNKRKQKYPRIAPSPALAITVWENEDWIRKNAQAPRLCFSDSRCFRVMKNQKNLLRSKKSYRALKMQENWLSVNQILMQQQVSSANSLKSKIEACNIDNKSCFIKIFCKVQQKRAIEVQS